MNEPRVDARAAFPDGDLLRPVHAPARVSRAVELARREVGVAEPQTNATAKPVGLECPDCGCRHFRVLENEPKRRYIYRRRECRHCGRRVTTSERIIG